MYSKKTCKIKKIIYTEEKRMHVVLINTWHQPVILNKNTVDNWGYTLSHDVVMLKGYYYERANNLPCKYKTKITCFLYLCRNIFQGQITIR